MWPDTRLRDLLGIRYPIIQAPMAGSSSMELALGVAEAGGLGSLPCALMNRESLRSALMTVRDAPVPINLNFFAHRESDGGGANDAAWLGRLSPYYTELGTEPPASLSSGPVRSFDDDACALVEEFKPAVVSFHFGLPEEGLLLRVKATGARILGSATTVDEAQWLEASGCDAVIAQGFEAGGHRGMFMSGDLYGQMGTPALTPQIADAVAVPVVAAGGIADGRGVAAAFALGASGVQIGTAYLFCDEALIGELYRDALQSGEPPRTAVTNVFSGRPARCIANRAVLEIGPMAGDAPDFPKGFSAMGPLKAVAELRRDSGFSALYCGQAARLAYPATAAELTHRIAADALSRLKWTAGAMESSAHSV